MELKRYCERYGEKKRRYSETILNSSFKKNIHNFFDLNAQNYSSFCVSLISSGATFCNLFNLCMLFMASINILVLRTILVVLTLISTVFQHQTLRKPLRMISYSHCSICTQQKDILTILFSKIIRKHI